MAWTLEEEQEAGRNVAGATYSRLAEEQRAGQDAARMNMKLTEELEAGQCASQLATGFSVLTR